MDGAKLRAAREAAGFSLSRMAALTHYSKPYLSQLENGHRTVSAQHVQAYSRALDVPIGALYGPTNDPLRVAHEWLLADSPAAVHSGAGRHVGASLASELERRVVELRHLDDTVGGGDLFPLVRRELSEAQHVLNDSSFATDIGRRLLIVVGELSQLAGWVGSDAGRYREAQRIYLDGVSAANDAGDRPLAGQLLSSLSYQMANVGDPADATLLARSAVAGAKGATPVVNALLLERVAWASARSRDADGARRALDAVDDAFDRRSDSIQEPEWVYWLDRKEIDVMAARCLIELGSPVAAQPLLSAAIAAYPSDHAREVALYETWLAESYARAGILDAARETIRHARKAANGVNSTRLHLRITAVQRLIP